MNLNLNEFIDFGIAIKSLLLCLCLYVSRRDRIVKRNLKLYFLLYVGAYLCLSAPKLFSAESEGTVIIDARVQDDYFKDFYDQHFFETEEGFTLMPILRSPYNIEDYIEFKKGVPSRDELVQKICFHYREYCDARDKAEKAVKSVNIWDNTFEDLFIAAATVITTHGPNSYVKGYSTAIVLYITQNFVRFWKAGEEIYIQSVRMDCEAELVDFYMRFLKHVYGV